MPATANYAPLPSIAVIGGGIYGCVVSLYLARCNYQVTLIEKDSSLFSGCSGDFGIRLHHGPHYPRSRATRQAVQAVYRRFKEEFPQLIVPVQKALYGVGKEDAEGLTSRVSVEEFDEVCKEIGGERADPKKYGIRGVEGLWEVEEGVVYRDEGERVFAQLLAAERNVKVKLGWKVRKVEKRGMKVNLDDQDFDWVINCTYFRSFGKREVWGKDVVYQTCVTLMYEDLQWQKGELPRTFTVMDGWFPNLTPVVEKRKKDRMMYKMYHAKYSLLGTFETYEESEKMVRELREEWVEKEVRGRMERDMERYMQGFGKRFSYSGFVAGSATKIRTGSEMRRMLVWNEGRLVQVLSGKVSESLSAADRVLEIVNGYMQYKRDVEEQVRTELEGEIEIDGACDMGTHRWNIA